MLLLPKFTHKFKDIQSRTFNSCNSFWRQSVNCLHHTYGNLTSKAIKSVQIRPPLKAASNGEEQFGRLFYTFPWSGVFPCDIFRSIHACRRLS